MDFIPGYLNVFRFLHSLSALTFCVVMTAMYVTGTTPPRIGSLRTLLLALYAFFKVIVMLSGIGLQSGSVLPDLDILHFIFYMTEFCFLLVFSLSLLKISPSRIALFAFCGCLMTFGSLLVSGRYSVFFPMVFLAAPAMMLSGRAMFSLAREAEEKREKTVYGRIGLLQILYFFLMVSVVIQYLPALSQTTWFAVIEPFIRLASTFVLLVIAGYFCSLACGAEFKPRFRRFLLFSFVFMCLSLLVLYWCVSCGIRKSMRDTRDRLASLQKDLSDSLSDYTRILNILADSHTLSAKDPIISRLLAVYGVTPFFLNLDDVCVSSSDTRLIGMNFKSAIPVAGADGVRCVFMRDFPPEKGGFYLVRDILSVDGVKLGAVLLKTKSPLFHFHIPPGDSFFVVLPDKNILADSFGGLPCARYKKISRYSITLEYADGRTEDYSGKRFSFEGFHTFAWTSLEKPEFLRDSMLVLCSESEYPAILSRAGFQIIAICWTILLLCFCLRFFRRTVAEKNALFQTVRDSYCRNCSAPTILIRERDCSVVFANAAAEREFRVRPGSLTGKRVSDLFRSAGLLPLSEAVNMAMSRSSADFYSGFFHPNGTGEIFCIYILLPSPFFMNTDDDEKLCTLRFLVRNDSAEGDPVNACAWLAFSKGIPDPAFLLSASGQIVSGNFPEITGRNPAEIADAFPADTAQKILAEAKAVMQSGQKKTFYADFPVGNSVSMPYEILLFPVSRNFEYTEYPLTGVVTRNINKLRCLEESFRNIRQQGGTPSI